jgi:hypothetical protein
VVNSSGYIVDGISLVHGMRVLFTADTDSLVKNRIYKVNFVTVGGNSVINLTQEADGIPQDGQTVYAELGANYQGKTFYFSEAENAWQQGQTKTALNQKPLFSLQDNNDIKFNDQTVYQNSSFAGAAVFEYKISETSPVDTVLGLRVKYNTINNVGDITFTSDLGSGSFTYKSGENVVSKFFGTGHITYITSRTQNEPKTSWIKRIEDSKQRVIRTFIVEANELRLFPVDVFANSVQLEDLDVHVEFEVYVEAEVYVEVDARYKWKRGYK